MKQTPRMSRSRSGQGSCPSTRRPPWYGVRSRIALSAVVFPAPLGPTSPRMWSSVTRKLMPSSATVPPNLFRSSRASMQAMKSAPLPIEQVFRLQAEPLDGCIDPGPIFAEKLLPFALQQHLAGARIDVHAAAAPGFDQPLVHQLLIALQHRERIDPIFRCDVAHGRQRTALLQHPVQDHRTPPSPQLPLNLPTVVPLTLHQGYEITPFVRSRSRR